MKVNKKEINKKAGSLMDKLKKNTSLKNVSIITESDLFNEVDDVATTAIPMINVALGGSIDGGIGRGITSIAGPSKHFKTSFALVMVAGFLNKHEDGVCLFYDNEFGAKEEYFDAYGVDTSRVIHNPFSNIEELKFDIVKQLSELENTDRVIILIDSIGNAASKKEEVEDALSEKSAADMTRAKQLKSLFRMITPQLNLKKIPLIAINHTYQTQEMFSKTIMGGGEGAIYSSNTILFVTKSKLKEGDEHTGSYFTLVANKSRYIKENVKIPITVRLNGGIAKWSGFEELAEEWGVIEKCRISRSLGYQYDSMKKGLIQVKATEIDSANDFWNLVLEETDLKQRIEAHFKLSVVKPLELEIVDETEEIAE